MEILELNLRHFGKFTDYKLELHAGINIISGGNETGKSTLHAFIRAMFYGLGRTRSRALDEYQLRQPWENPAWFEGSMRILYDGKIYRIDRNFYRKDARVSVVCETDGMQAEDPEAALRIFTAGLSETDFDNTVFIRQTGQAVSAQLGEHIRDFLVNVEQSGNADMDVRAAQEFLKRRRRAVESEKNEKLTAIEAGISSGLQETEYLNRDLERLLERASAGASQEPAGASFQRREAEETQSAEPGYASAPETGADQGVSASPAAGEPDRTRAASPAAGEPDRIRTASPAEAADGSGLAGSPAPGEADRGLTMSGITDTEEEYPEDAEPSEPAEESGGLLMPVLIFLSFAAAGLALACAFVTIDHRMRYVLGAGSALFLVIALALLYHLTHPESRARRAEKRAGREAFLERHLGFREDPDDPQEREERMMRERRRQEAVRRAREMDLREQEESERRTLQERARREAAQQLRMRKEILSEQAGRVPGTPLDLSAQVPASEPSAPAPASESSGPAPVLGAPAEGLRAGGAEELLRRERATGRSEEIRQEIVQRREKLEQCRSRLEDLYAEKAALGAYDRELQAIDLASARIRDLSGKIYHESGEQFRENVSALLAGLTEGRYSSISLDERMQVKINTPDHLLSIDQVSCGTMHQIYFALRLAAGELLTGGAELPVLLDEPFAMYDEERLESALRYLMSLGRQVIRFSCQKRELETLARIRKQ